MHVTLEEHLCEWIFTWVNKDFYSIRREVDGSSGELIFSETNNLYLALCTKIFNPNSSPTDWIAVLPTEYNFWGVSPPTHTHPPYLRPWPEGNVLAFVEYLKKYLGQGTSRQDQSHNDLYIVRYPVAVYWKTYCTCGQGRTARTTGARYARCNNPNKKTKKGPRDAGIAEPVKY
jgi:hypothetical protein